MKCSSKDGIVHIWDVPIGAVAPHPDAKPLKISYFTKDDQCDLTSLDWSCDGQLLAIGSYDSILRVCTPSGKLYFSHKQHEVKNSGLGMIYDTYLYYVEKGPIFAAKFNKSGTLLVTASLDGTSCLWNMKTKELMLQYKRHSGNVFLKSN